MSEQLLNVRLPHKTFRTPQGESVTALHNIDLRVRRGEFITLIGPSGCGKSTLLKIMAGLDTEHDGEVLLEGKPVTKPGIDLGFVFQEHRLFPWLSVEKNIAADLSLRQPEVRRRVSELVELVKLQGFEKAYPRQLSGGMSQRVAIARALLRSPKVLLLDEPFGALDAFTRSHLQEVTLDIWDNNRTTMILVTHDIDEAIYLAGRVVIMDARPGTIRKTIPIDLPYPRKKASSSFQELRTIVLREFERVEELELVDSSGI
ncbi:sulfonate ABC transporter ATP-binding protein [Gordoniibacillus kamchatkensis]|uniref:Sulfonate ABC transporter ATP-binding protein n=1 Tax=Gordoniibacillus kamchatkensis TaxID=1590651 RepID=A0ABR5AIE5_9BACL|nr:ABC transporter ATP-binding protein [Paenibacillus sp. VKM B-2647]KIL40789.1 sulfonate ABC transporter ATP-binding protein [Paenibacillus sp. VKM B-2647]